MMILSAPPPRTPPAEEVMRAFLRVLETLARRKRRPRRSLRR